MLEKWQTEFLDNKSLCFNLILKYISFLVISVIHCFYSKDNWHNLLKKSRFQRKSGFAFKDLYIIGLVRKGEF